MKKILFILFAILVIFSAYSEDLVIYEIKNRSSNDIFSVNIVSTEALKALTPMEFKKSNNIFFSSIAEGQFSVSEKGLPVGRWEDYSILSRTVKVDYMPNLPEPDKIQTVKFSIESLVKDGGPYRYSPMMYALVLALNRTAYTSGKAWVQSLSFSGVNFTAKVAIINS